MVAATHVADCYRRLSKLPVDQVERPTARLCHKHPTFLFSFKLLHHVLFPSYILTRIADSKSGCTVAMTKRCSRTTSCLWVVLIMPQCNVLINFKSSRSHCIHSEMPRSNFSNAASCHTPNKQAQNVVGEPTDTVCTSASSQKDRELTACRDDVPCSSACELHQAERCSGSAAGPGCWSR